ncbi:hypothetical protein EZS27_008459 [termite gut metagenome]|uniref:Uncharacterized protein n=1 Tax=termite gut metagenome TaxID=433724 RepID=A0A5J4SDE1_9ZZZZ
MAIIQSLAVGKARKSAGNITYRTVRGRTILSSKVAPYSRQTRSDAQSEAQSNFKKVSQFMALVKDDINVSFDKTKYGSQRNNFFKLNKEALFAAFETLPVEGVLTLEDYNAALVTYVMANPKTILRVKKRNEETVYLMGDWSSQDNPQASKLLSISYDGVTKPEGGVLKLSTSKTIRLTGRNVDLSLITLQVVLPPMGNPTIVELTSVFTQVSSSAAEFVGTTLSAYNNYNVKVIYYDNVPFRTFNE